jgi:glycogen operon protein
MVNAWRESLAFELPPARDLPTGGWRRWLDTSLPSPADIVPPDEAPAVGDGIYTLPGHSVGVLFTRAGSRHSREIS